MIISVTHLSKHFKTYKKEPGFVGAITSFFNRSYETKKAVDDISFQIEEGELVGFIGPNGAGKTTTLKALSGLLYPTQGTVSVLGYTPFQRKSQFLKQISLVMGQKNQLWWDLPAQESFLLNKEIYQVSDSQYKKTMTELVELLQVSTLLKIPIRKLSLGERMKMELIASLIHSPKVLFLDEPTIGLDVVMQKHVRDFIKKYNAQRKATILLTSHYMEDVRQLASRVIVIDHGKMMFDGRLNELIKVYAPFKYLSIMLEHPVPEKELLKLGALVKHIFPKVVLKVKREKVKEMAIKILTTLPVEDLTIEEPDMEGIVRDMFASNQQVKQQ